MGTTAPPHELFEDGPRAGAVYKAGFAALTAPVYKADFAALTAPGVMAGAVGGPVARALPPRPHSPRLGGGCVGNAVSQIHVISIQVRQGVASRSPQDWA